MWWIWAIETDVPWPAEATDVIYEGRAFDLAPPTETDYASIATDASLDDSAAVSKAIHRFLSVLAWIDGRSMRVLWSVGNPGWRQPMRRMAPLARLHFQPRSDFDFLPVPASEKAALAVLSMEPPSPPKMILYIDDPKFIGARCVVRKLRSAFGITATSPNFLLRVFLSELDENDS